jgi:hypothetical protein
MKRRLALSAFLLCALPLVAHGQGMRECASAAESGQLLRNSGKLVEAKRELLKCMKQCPRVVTNDCGNWLNDVEQRMPTVVFKAFDAGGREVTNVKVTVDGATVSMGLDARAIEIDPGTHRIVFERKGNIEVEQTVTIREGEKVHPVEARFAATAEEAKSTIPVSAIVLGGVGLAALGTFAVFHLSAKSDLDTLREGCAPRCPDSEVEALDQKIFVSNIALGVGITALLGAAFVFFVDRPSSSSSSALRSPFLVRF